MVASFDRPEHGARALPKLVAEALGIDGYDALLHETSASETRDLIDRLVTEAVRQFSDGRAEAAVDWLNSKASVDISKHRVRASRSGEQGFPRSDHSSSLTLGLTIAVTRALNSSARNRCLNVSTPLMQRTGIS